MEASRSQRHTDQVMTGFDRGSQFAVSVLGSRAGSAYGDGGRDGQSALKPSETIRALFDFVQHYREGESFIYRDRLRANLLAKQFVLEVDLDHLIAFNEDLANRIRETPAEIVPLVSATTTTWSTPADARSCSLRLLYGDVQNRSSRHCHEEVSMQQETMQNTIRLKKMEHASP